MTPAAFCLQFLTQWPNGRRKYVHGVHTCSLAICDIFRGAIFRYLDRHAERRSPRLSATTSWMQWNFLARHYSRYSTEKIPKYDSRASQCSFLCICTSCRAVLATRRRESTNKKRVLPFWR